jgi:fluoride ion exporter CrcB/FEX
MDQQQLQEKDQESQSQRQPRESFRRRSIDAAHDVSAIDWSSSFYQTSTSSIPNSGQQHIRKRRSASIRRSNSVGFYRRENDYNARNDSVRTSDFLPSERIEEGKEYHYDNQRKIEQKPTIGSTSTTSTRQQSWLLNRHFHTLVSLAVFSYLGDFLRFVSAQVFGLVCHKPETVNWNDSGWLPCTAAPGTTASTGGAFFTDLPANAIGCFLMGLLVTGGADDDTATTTTPVFHTIPMAMLPKNCFFQQWTVTHVGMRTGFCGALTTFASWNTQMVVMICGGSATEIGSSQWVSAFWGYLVGLFVALESFVLGKSVAFALSRRFNPQEAKEADLIMDKREMGVMVDRELPDFERRYLYNIILDEEKNSAENFERQMAEEEEKNPSILQRYGNDVYQPLFDDHIHHLQEWKENTQQHRHMASPYLHLLHTIEKNVLLEREEPRQELLDIARDAGWNVNALRKWTAALDEDGTNHLNESIEEEMDLEAKEFNETLWNSDHSILEFLSNGIAFMLFSGLFIWGAVIYDKMDPVSINFRNQFMSALFSPFGTFVRWYLSSLNGSIKRRRWEWLPIGTLLANILAVVVSALMQGLLHTIDMDQYLARSFLEAIKVGFAGSLSTMSTFAAETVGLFRALPRYFWGWYYAFGTLVLGLLFGVLSYFWAV